jgi:hypothetical protein
MADLAMEIIYGAAIIGFLICGIIATGRHRGTPAGK